MAKLPMVPQKIFGSTGGTGEFGAFGSDSIGAAVTTKDLATIQSLAPYLQGLFAATDNANEPPRIQDLNSLFLLLTSQIAYMFQNGVPEWHTDNDYYATVSYCQKGGIIYRSVTGADGSPQKGHDPATDDGTYWEPGDSSLRQLKWDLDTLGFTGYALYTDKYLESKKSKAFARPLGAWEFTDGKLIPTAFSAARSTAHPEYPEYCPYIPRFDANHVISTAQVPQSVIDYFNAQVVEVSGYSSFTATLAAGVLTFATSTQNDALVKLVAADALVNRWHDSGEIPTFAALGGLFTGARQLCVTVAGVNYPITSAATAVNTITVPTLSGSGSVTVEIGPTRIAGSTTSARLRKVSGFVPVVGGDATGEVAIMMDAMDRLMSHLHETNADALDVSGQAYGETAGTSGPASITPPVTDPAFGSVRTGKTTNPRTHGVGGYTNLGVLIATTWTSA